MYRLVEVFRGAEQAGIRVPDAFSCTGFDEIVPGRIALYAFTAMVQLEIEIGQVEGEAIGRTLAAHTACSVSMTCVFRLRNTTGVPH